MEPNLRLVQDDELCQHTHTQGGTTWGCTRRPHPNDTDHLMVPIPKELAS